MENTKENRLAFLHQQFTPLTQGVDQEKLLIAVGKLNGSLSRKRKVVVITKGSELGSELWSEPRFKIWEYFESIWPIFIREFYPQLKVIKRNKKKIDILQQIVEAGNAYIWISKKNLYVLPFPEIHLDNKRLHNDKGSALKFADKKTYWLYGIKFDHKDWKWVVSKKVDPKFILSLDNIEQRMAAIKLKGAEWLIKNTKAKRIGKKSKKGNELYLVKGIFNRDAYFVKYSCLSTGRVYFSGVAPDFANSPEELTADNAMAWKYSLTLSEYESLEIET